MLCVVLCLPCCSLHVLIPEAERAEAIRLAQESKKKDDMDSDDDDDEKKA